MSTFELISHHLCPYAQRVSISLTEKRLPFRRTNIDLSNKPDWFINLSPTGKVPVLLVNDKPIFESSAILEFLEDISDHPLHPEDSLVRAQHRAYIEMGSAILGQIYNLYTASHQAAFDAARDKIVGQFHQLAKRLGKGPYFEGKKFTLVDTVFAPVFRYFNVIDSLTTKPILPTEGNLSNWRKQLSNRPSVVQAVDGDYEDRLLDFFVKKDSLLGAMARQFQSAQGS